ncbi:MAG: putative adhesin [Bacteroidota bacterium]|jgi:hypothetical protein
MKKYSLLILAFFSYTNGFAQHDWIWQLSYKSTNPYPKCFLDYSNGSPDTSSVMRYIGFFISSGSQSDSNGNYIFSSNGQFISNAVHDTMMNSLGFNPCYETDVYYPWNEGCASTQGLLTLPHPDPDSSHLYYLFHECTDTATVNGNLDGMPFSLRYSVIDMNLGGGLGGVDVNRKTVVLVDDTLIKGRITATKHANGRDWWVVKHKYFSDIYYISLLTPQGITVDTQKIGALLPQVGGNPLGDYDLYGMAGFSPQGEKYAQVSAINEMEYMEFDRCTGRFSNAQTIYIPDSLGIFGSTGLAFSPSGRFLYVISLYRIWQFDTWAPDLSASRLTVADYDGFVWFVETTFFLPQLAPDGKIYISTFHGTKYMHVINEPDSFGLACNITQHSLIIREPITSNSTVPNFVNYNLGADTNSICDSLHVGYSEQQNSITVLKVWPNPASDVLSVGYHLPEGKTGWIKLYHTDGKLLQQVALSSYSTLQHLDVSGLANGIYLVSIESGGKRKSVRVAKIKL